ncbi:signal recognition particle-docking protein FtsY [Rouxiella sp. Mn2063]|uniref:signal recognition particle-docking protein FtsY n=1 Tax=Rouxiella sp. Mn2063 TaxID=3395262 RepID=UPI003BEC8DD2
MAKQKKRGFFSWLGLGGKEEEQKPSIETTDAPKTEQPVDVVEPIDAVEPVNAAEDVAKGVEPDAQLSQVEPAIIEDVLAEDKPAAESFAENVVVVTEEVAALQHPAQPEIAQVEVEEQAVVEEIIEPEPVVVPEVQEAAALPVELEPIISAPAVETEQKRPTKEGFFARLKRSLVKTRQNLGSGFVSLFRGKKIDDDLFEELEEQLLIADVGVETSRKIIASLTEHATRRQLKDADSLYVKLKEEMSEILAKVDQPLDVSGKTPYVILMVGVNGVGKTTTIGKLARQFEAEGKSVMLAAGDTFRAAAVEQLQVWGQRNNIPVIAQHTGADSASVIFDAIQAAKARGADVLIADTAGRLQNKSHLMEELKKIVRVMKKLDEDAPHEVMLTLDASTGQNAVSQAKLFNEAVGLTGITLTKLDGTAKGGVIFAIADQFGIPIRYIGVGEGIEDLRPFKADDFIEALFARED